MNYEWYNVPWFPFINHEMLSLWCKDSNYSSFSLFLWFVFKFPFFPHVKWNNFVPNFTYKLQQLMRFFCVPRKSEVKNKWGPLSDVYKKKFNSWWKKSWSLIYASSIHSKIHMWSSTTNCFVMTCCIATKVVSLAYLHYPKKIINKKTHYQMQE